MIVYDSQRRPVELGESVGHGGEATVYRVLGYPDELAKIYEPEPRPNYAGKLSWMANHPPENPTRGLDHPSLAWPGGLLFDSLRRLKGYWMPYIQRTVPLLEVFNPRRRAEVLPEFDRRYLLRTARNLAAALSALHNSGYVAGDLNESNVLVTPTALVTLIDTDSFQVSEERDGSLIVHPCPVGKPEYTPPELQGKPLADVVRLPDHDSFGLAVLIFQLLMEGSHPFRAQWLSAGDPPPLEVRIANGAYPYVEKPPYPVLPPKNALGIETLHPWLQELFRRCFVDGHRDLRWRPGPELWSRALTEAEQAQVRCAEGHYYSSHLSECPYCALVQKRLVQQPGRRSAPHPTTDRPATPRGRSAWSPPPFAQARPAAAGAAVGASAGSSPAAAASASASSASGGGSSAFGSSNPFGGRGWSRTVINLGSAVLRAAIANQINSAAPVPGSASIFGSPYTGPAGGVLRSQPIIPPGALKNWARQQAYKSLAFGGGQGALAGAIPGALIGLTNWSVGNPLAWSLLIAAGGASAGLLRGWNPGHKIASVIDRYIGWKLFWEAIGLVIGTSAGFILSLAFAWAVIPVILGLILGGQTGLFLGRKVWQVGKLVGWERIWGAVSAFGFGALGYGLAQLIGLIGFNTLGSNLADGLLPFAANSSLMWAMIWMLAGGAGGAISGALAGILTDLIGRFTRLVD